MRLKIIFVILAFLLIPFVAMADGLAKEELFQGLGQEVINQAISESPKR